MRRQMANRDDEHSAETDRQRLLEVSESGLGHARQRSSLSGRPAGQVTKHSAVEQTFDGIYFMTTALSETL
jgi:hypothetical protein